MPKKGCFIYTPEELAERQKQARREYERRRRAERNAKACTRVYCDVCDKDINYSYMSSHKKQDVHIRNERNHNAMQKFIN